MYELEPSSTLVSVILDIQMVASRCYPGKFAAGNAVSRPDLYQLACHRESNPDFPQITLRENAQVDPLAVT